MDQFQVILQAIFEKAGIEKSLKDVQTLAKQLPIEMTAKLNSASTRNDFKKFANEIANDFNKTLGTNLTGKDVMSAYDQMISGAKKASKEQDIIADKIARTREKTEQLRQSEEKRQQLAQSNAINKNLEQEYIQRERILSKIRESQNTGDLKTKFDTTATSYANLDKLGVISDKLKTDFAQLKFTHEELGKSSTDDDLIANYTKFDTILKTVNNSLKQVKTSELSSLKEAQQQVDFDSKRALSVQKISTYLKDNSKLLSESKKATSANYEEAKKWHNKILNIQDALRSLDTSDLTNQNQYKILTQQLATAKSKVKELGLEGRSTTEEIKNMFQKFTGWFSISQGVMLGMSKIREAVIELKGIDTTLTEITKTANATAKQLAKIEDDSFETASGYGAKANDYLIGVQEMSRAGYENSEQMAELATLAQSAGDMTAELANDYLIASDAAYGYAGDVEKLNALLDSQNQVTNKNAVNMTELANATKIVASQASQSGIAENKLTAVLSTMIATTKQGGEIAARAFKGILMNLQQVSGELDGEVIDEESFKKVESRLHSVGVAMEEVSNGAAVLRDPIKILGELANVYNSLPDNSADKAGIIADLGGKYRGGQLAALLSNWEKYEKILGDYENSSGSAMNEAMKSANNFEGSLNRLSNTWVDTVKNIVDSKGLTTTVNGLNGFLGIINKLTSALGGLGTVATIGGGILGAKNLGRAKMFAL